MKKMMAQGQGAARVDAWMGGCRGWDRWDATMRWVQCDSTT